MTNHQKEIEMSAGDVKVEPHTKSGMDVKGDRTDHQSGKISMLQICEVLLLTPMMVIIIVLFLIPTALYGLHSKVRSKSYTMDNSPWGDVADPGFWDSCTGGYNCSR